MITIRKAAERGHADHGWLNAYHTFSFAGYRDPEHIGFRSLRVMNEDRIAPGQGFGTHPHSDMEIITYVLEGALEHKDSMGNGEVLHAGEFQLMSAGSGITHSEFNPSATSPTHLYQIWLEPKEKGITPSYEQKDFGIETVNNLRLVASPDGAMGSLRINQNARIYLSKLDEGNSLSHQLRSGHHLWIQLLRGSVVINGNSLQVSDGVAISDEDRIEIEAETPSEIIMFEMQ